MNYKQFLESKKTIVVPCGISVTDSDLNPILFGFQRVIVKWALKRGKAAIWADCGLGKGQPYGSKVLTPIGWKNIEDLKIGNEIISGEGKIQKVTGVYPKNEINTYRFYYSDSTSCVFDEEHLHICRTNNDRQRNNGWKVLSTKQLLNMPIRYGNKGKSRNWDIPVVKPIQFTKKELPISPYVLGVLLGDGCLKYNVMISSNDNEIVERVSRELPIGVILEKTGIHDYKIKTGNTGNRRHFFRQQLIDLGLFNILSAEKFIPDIYLFSSVKDRIDLLRGLMDTDGYIATCGTCQFYSVSKKLINNVLFLIRSLGGIPTLSKKKTSYIKNGIKTNCQDCYTLTFSLKTFNPFFLKRKAERYNIDPRDNGRWIDKIEYEGKQKTVCISVDSPDNSYVTEHFIVTHNSFMQLEWTKHIPGNILILAPLAVGHQTVKEGEKLGIKLSYQRQQCDIEDRITITNYEMIEHFDASYFNAVVLDESSILKAFDAKYRTKIIEQFRSTPYKLACTATPAPNDFMELGNHAEFLNICSYVEMLSTYFVHDGGETSKWRLKGHAKKDFWKWVASWAIMLRKPSDLGFSDEGFELPKLNYIHVPVETKKKPKTLMALPAITLQERIKARKESIEERVKAVCEIIIKNDLNRQQVTSEKWVIWCNLNSEQSFLESLFDNNCISIYGSLSACEKEQRLEKWLNTDIPILISKPSVVGFGINMQLCRNIIFAGLNDSFEQMYQAIRRCWRFGQKKEVNCYIVTADTEGAVITNIKRKELDFETMMNEMRNNMESYCKENIQGLRRESEEYKTDYKEGANWKMYHGDSCEIIKDIPSDSIHYSIFSPPFASLYTYSNTERDMGNSKDYGQFFTHFQFLVKELYRVIKPGRLLSFHCMLLPTTKSKHGYIGLENFRDDLIREFKKVGFIHHSEVVIWKDPVTAMQRTKALGLLHKQLKKDSCMSRQGIPDYLITMRKPGENTEPVSHTNKSFPVQMWQNYASPIWMDINPSDTLQYASAREHADERHICPLQLPVITRALKLWTNEGDTVLSPFAGIGSEGYCAIEMGRKFIGIELKESYYKQAYKNLENAQIKKSRRTLFDVSLYEIQP